MTNDQMNVGQKLAKARLMFLNQKIGKSGKNLKLEFKYFELEDIVPPAIRIFNRLGLVTETQIDNTNATMKVYNVEAMNEDPIVFTAPYREIEPIISKNGGVVTNNLQVLGASITYLRRYLWMMVLDVTEPDSIDPNLTDVEESEVIPVQKPKKTKAPATVEERAEAKKELTSENKKANEQQIADLKTLCKQLIAVDETQEEFIQKIAMKTDGFTNISEDTCKTLCENLKNMISEYGNPE